MGMNRVDRYIMAQVLRSTLLALSVIATLSFVISLVDGAGDVGVGDYHLTDAMLVMASMIPGFLYEAFPVAALIGGLLALGSMAARSELVALQAAGMSPLRLMGSLFKAGLVLVLLLFLIGDLIGPKAEAWGIAYRLKKMNRQIGFSGNSGFWMKDKGAFINIRRATPDGGLREIYIYETGKEGQLRRITHARRGRYEARAWRLDTVNRATLSSEKISLAQLPRFRWRSAVDPALVRAALTRPTLQPLWEIWQQIETLRANGQSAVEQLLSFWNKLSMPLSMLAMLMLSVPLVTGSQRRVHVGQNVFLGAIIGAGFYMVSKGVYYAVIVFDLWTILVALFPVVVFLMALLLLAHARRL